MDYIVRYFFQKLRLLFAIFWKSRTSPQNRPLRIDRPLLVITACNDMIILTETKKVAVINSKRKYL